MSLSSFLSPSGVPLIKEVNGSQAGCFAPSSLSRDCVFQLDSLGQESQPVLGVRGSTMIDSPLRSTWSFLVIGKYFGHI